MDPLRQIIFPVITGLAIFLFFYFLEKHRPNLAEYPRIKNQERHGVLLFFINRAVAFLFFYWAGNLLYYQNWHVGYLVELRRFWAGIPFIISFVAAGLVYTFAQYWSHRLFHMVPVLHRAHFMHHSPRRYSVFLSLYNHPLNAVFNYGVFFALLFSGFSFATILIFGPLRNVVDCIQHLNIATPKWLGYVLVRPEYHKVHHHLHTHNYGMLPLWDMLFGTYRKPESPEMPVGFSPRLDDKFWTMLLLRRPD